eukprot:4045695-Amphidinium_carterae.1
MKYFEASRSVQQFQPLGCFPGVYEGCQSQGLEATALLAESDVSQTTPALSTPPTTTPLVSNVSGNASANVAAEEDDRGVAWPGNPQSVPRAEQEKKSHCRQKTLL